MYNLEGLMSSLETSKPDSAGGPGASSLKTARVAGQRGSRRSQALSGPCAAFRAPWKCVRCKSQVLLFGDVFIIILFLQHKYEHNFPVKYQLEGRFQKSPPLNLHLT